MEEKIIDTRIFYGRCAGVAFIEPEPGKVAQINGHFQSPRWTQLTPQEKVKPGTFGYHLLAYKHFKDGNLEIIEDNDEYVIKFPDHTVYATMNPNSKTIAMTRGTTMSQISESVVLAAMMADKLNLWADPDLAPEMFCDAVYFTAKNYGEIKDFETDEATYLALVAKVENAVKMKSQPAPASKPASKKKSKKTGKTTLEEWWDDVKAGKYVVEYDGWNEKQRTKIKPLSELENVIPTPQIRRMVTVAHHFVSKARDLLVAGLEPDDANFVAFQMVGPAATGKTYACSMVNCALGLPFDESVMNPDAGVEVIEGETKVINSEFAYAQSVAGEALAEGTSILLDEFCQADTDRAVSSWNHVLYKPFQFYSNGVELKKRHPLSIVYTAYNTTEGVGNNIAASLKSRLAYVVPFDVPSDSMLLGMLSQIPDEEFIDCAYDKDAVVNWVFTAFKWAYNSLAAKPYLREFITFRAAEAIVKEIAAGVEPDDALPDLWAQLLSEDPEEAQAMQQGICRVLPNLN